MDPLVVEVIGTFVLVAGATAATGTAAAVGGVWYGVRRLRRSKRVRAGLERGSTSLRAISSDASSRRLAQQRLSVDSAVRHNSRALEAARIAGRPIGHLPIIAAELDTAGADLRDQLRVAINEPDAEVRATLAREFEDHVRQFCRLSADLRTASITGARASHAELESVAQRLTLEVSALQAWDQIYSEPSAGLPREGEGPRAGSSRVPRS